MSNHRPFQSSVVDLIEKENSSLRMDIQRGDCLEVLPRLKPASVHLVVTDPPYFLHGLDASWSKGQKNSPRSTGVVGGLPVGMRFDPRQGRALQDFMAAVGTLLLSAIKPGSFAVVFSQPRLVHRMAVGLEEAGFEIRDVYAWHFTKKAQCKAFGMDHFVDKMALCASERETIRRSMQGMKTAQLRPQFELMVFAQKPKEGTHIRNWIEHETGLMDARVLVRGQGPSTLMNFEKPDRSRRNHHLTVKPVPLLEHLIDLFSRPGQVVLDPFLGSGSTAVAARNRGRHCVGIEINPDYVELAELRLREGL